MGEIMLDAISVKVFIEPSNALSVKPYFFPAFNFSISGLRLFNRRYNIQAYMNPSSKAYALGLDVEKRMVGFLWQVFIVMQIHEGKTPGPLEAFLYGFIAHDPYLTVPYRIETCRILFDPISPNRILIIIASLPNPTRPDHIEADVTTIQK
jgi:hypothetical protein